MDPLIQSGRVLVLLSAASFPVPVKNQSVLIIQCKGQDTKSGRVSGLGVAKWSFVKQVSIASN